MNDTKTPAKLPKVKRGNHGHLGRHKRKRLQAETDYILGKAIRRTARVKVT